VITPVQRSPGIILHGQGLSQLIPETARSTADAQGSADARSNERDAHQNECGFYPVHAGILTWFDRLIDPLLPEGCSRQTGLYFCILPRSPRILQFAE
jgi:hypothetical protein